MIGHIMGDDEMWVSLGASQVELITTAPTYNVTFSMKDDKPEVLGHWYAMDNQVTFNKDSGRWYTQDNQEQMGKSFFGVDRGPPPMPDYVPDSSPGHWEYLIHWRWVPETWWGKLKMQSRRFFRWFVSNAD